jgi:hypothetical protein
MVSTAQDIMSRYGIDQDFAASIESLGNDLGVDPMYLANTMYAESRLDPSVKNMAGSGATGLIQFMPQTAANLGTTTDELSRMTPVEQMEYVRRYFSADNLGAGRLRDLQNDPSQHNVNMAVFLPSMIGKPVDTQIPQKYFRQNGSIRTPADYTRSAEERVNAYIQGNPADTQADTVDAQTNKMLFEEQPEDTFRPEVVPASLYTDAVISSTDEEALEVDDTLMAEHEEKIRRGEAPRGSKPTEEGGYYTEGEYGFRTNPAGEVVADLEVNSLENVATSVGERLRTILGNNEDSETLELKGGGSVEKEVEFVKEDDDDVPDPPPGATPEEVADDIPAYLSTGEYVLPANVVRYIGLKNITGMHQRALSELQQMEDLDIIENVDENGYVEEDDDEMDYMKPEGVVEIVVAEHHPKGLMVQDAPRGSGGIASLPRTAEIQGQYHVLSYLTSDEQQMLRDAGGGLGLDGAQIYGPGGVPAFPEPGMGGNNDHGGTGGGKGGDGNGPAGTPSGSSGVGSGVGGAPGGPATGGGRGGGDGKGGNTGGDGGSDPYGGPAAGGAAPAAPAGSPIDRALEDVVKAVTRVSLLEQAEEDFAEVNQKARNRGISVTDGRGYSGPPGSPPGPAFGGGDEGNDVGGSQEFSEEEKADTDTEKSTNTDPLSDYIYVPGVGYRRKIRSVKPLSELKAGGYVTRNGIMAKGYSKGGDPGDGHGGGMSEFVEDLEPEVVEEEKPTDPYEGYTYVKGIGYVPTSRRATSNKPIESASLALSSIFTPGFLSTIGLMGDPNKEL